MDIVTIACPLGYTDPNVDPETAPAWTDGTNDYWVASGLIEGYTLEDGGELIPYITSDPLLVQPHRVNVIVGMSGIDALAEMGLTPKVEDIK